MLWGVGKTWKRMDVGCRERWGGGGGGEKHLKKKTVKRAREKTDTSKCGENGSGKPSSYNTGRDKHMY